MTHGEMIIQKVLIYQRCSFCPVNATEYIKSGYFKALAELNLERIPYVKMPQWQPANGYAMVNHLIFNQMKPGNKFDLKMTFANGEELVTKDYKL